MTGLDYARGARALLGGEPSPPAAVAARTPRKNRIDWISTAAIFEPLPPTKWIVPELYLGPGRPAMLAAYGYTGKSLMAQSLALACAAGVPVWDRFATAGAARVRHLDHEQGRHATLKRYQRLAAGMGLSMRDLGDRLEVAVHPRLFLTDRDAEEVLTREFDGVALGIGDALRGLTPGQDENDSKIAAYLHLLARVSEKTGTCFVLIHHAGKPKADAPKDNRALPRGSSAIFDACGCVLVVSGAKGEPKHVQQQKAPAEAEGAAVDDFWLSIDDVGRPDSSPALRVAVCEPPDESDEQAAEASNSIERAKARIVALVASTRDLRSENEIARRIGGRRKLVGDALNELEERGVLIRRGGVFALASSRDT